MVGIARRTSRTKIRTSAKIRAGIRMIGGPVATSRTSPITPHIREIIRSNTLNGLDGTMMEGALAGNCWRIFLFVKRRMGRRLERWR